MSTGQLQLEEVGRLTGLLLEGALDAEDRRRLEETLLADPAALQYYQNYVDIHSLLHWQYGLSEACGAKDLIQQDSEVSAPPTLFPLPSPLSSSFVGGPVFSYMVASVVLCLMLLGAWAYKITRDYRDFARDNSRRSTISGSLDRQQLVFVGRITGMKNCRWADPDSYAIVGASVPLDRQYALSSGLLEITCKTGAKVILEGPCTYKVEAIAGGFLERGKLTAKIRTQSSKPTTQSPEPSPLSSLPSPLFSVRTPTAVVTDLGTEFGVEVAENGDTTSYVFQGSVKVEILPSPACGRGARGEGASILLKAGESARVEKDEALGGTGIASGTLRIVTGDVVAVLPKFVRRIYEPSKLLDLLDVVAGGDGTGRRREHGIDPATGKQDTWFVDGQRTDDHAYHRVAWNPLIDGVFMPYVPTSLPPQPQEVQLDSAGNTFDDFLKARCTEKHPNLHCTLHGDTIGGIWARAADADSAAKSGWIYALTNAEQFMPEGRGLLGIHANAGLTFDLAAIRDKHEGTCPVRLRGTVGMGDGPRAYPDSFGMADLWIFVDGKLKWVRKDITAKDGAITAAVTLKPTDRFLTIVSTRGQHGKSYDWMVVGDPVLELSSIETEGESVK